MRARAMQRAVESLGLLVAGSVLIFALLRAAPGGLVAPYLQAPGITAVQIAALTNELGPDRPVFLQYFAWLLRVLRGDLGWSPSTSQPVAQAIADGLQWTIPLAFSAFVASMLLGGLVGIARARLRAPFPRAALAALELVTRSVPVSVFAKFLLVLWIVTPGMQAFAPVVPVSREAFDIGDRVRHLVVPTLVFALLFGGWVSCLFHEFFRRRDRDARLLARDLLAPAAAGIIQIGPVVLAAAITTEVALGLPGAGQLFRSATQQSDFGLFFAVLLACWTSIVLIALLGELIAAAVRETPAGAAPGPVSAPRGWRVLFANRKTAVGAVLCAVLAAVALGANLISPADPNFIDLAHWQGYPLAPGVAGHLLGTDENGRDLLSRLLHGLRISLAVALFAGLAATAIGLAVGVALARFSKPLPSFTGRAVIATAGIRSFTWLPFLIAAIVIVYVNKVRYGPSMMTLFIAAVSWPAIARAGRAPSGRRLRAVCAAAVGAVGGALLLEITLSLNGLGIQPPAPSLGNMLVNATSNLFQAPWADVAPTVAAVLALFALYAFADGLRESMGDAP